MWPNPQFPADLVKLTEEILNENLHFLCSGKWNFLKKILVFYKGTFRKKFLRSIKIIIWSSLIYHLLLYLCAKGFLHLVEEVPQRGKFKYARLFRISDPRRVQIHAIDISAYCQRYAISVRPHCSYISHS